MSNNIRRILSPISEGDETEDNTTPTLENPIDGNSNFITVQGNAVGTTQPVLATTMFGPYDFVSTSNPVTLNSNNDQIQGSTVFLPIENFPFTQENNNIIYPLGFPEGISEEEYREITRTRMGKRNKNTIKPQNTAVRKSSMTSAQRERRKEYIRAFANPEGTTPENLLLNYIELDPGVRLSPYGLNYQEAVNLGLIDPTQGTNWNLYGAMNAPSVSPMYYVPTAQNFRSMLRNPIPQQRQQYQTFIPSNYEQSLVPIFAGGRSVAVPAVPATQTAVSNPPSFWSRATSGLKKVGQRVTSWFGGRSKAVPAIPAVPALTYGATPPQENPFLTLPNVPVVGGRGQVSPPRSSSSNNLRRQSRPGSSILRPSVAPGVWKKFLTRAQSTWNSTRAVAKATGRGFINIGEAVWNNVVPRTQDLWNNTVSGVIPVVVNAAGRRLATASTTVGRGIATVANRGLNTVGRGLKRAGLAAYDIATGTAFPTFVTRAGKALRNVKQRTQNFFAGGRSAAVQAVPAVTMFRPTNLQVPRPEISLQGEQYNPFGQEIELQDYHLSENLTPTNDPLGVYTAGTVVQPTPYLSPIQVSRPELLIQGNVIGNSPLNTVDSSTRRVNLNTYSRLNPAVRRNTLMNSGLPQGQDNRQTQYVIVPNNPRNASPIYS